MIFRNAVASNSRFARPLATNPKSWEKGFGNLHKELKYKKYSILFYLRSGVETICSKIVCLNRVKDNGSFNPCEVVRFPVQCICIEPCARQYTITQTMAPSKMHPRMHPYTPRQNYPKMHPNMDPKTVLKMERKRAQEDIKISIDFWIEFWTVWRPRGTRLRRSCGMRAAGTPPPAPEGRSRAC